MTEERRTLRPVPSSLVGYLDQLPARVLLERLPFPMLAVAMDATVAYANPAFERLLGYPTDPPPGTVGTDADSDVTGVAAGEVSPVGEPVSRLLIGHRGPAQQGSVSALRTAAGTVTTWVHRDGTRVRAVVSESILMRDDDPVLLVSLNDVTEWEWTTGPALVTDVPDS